MQDGDFSDLIEQSKADERRARWQNAIRREMFLWRGGGPCPSCGEWIGHFGGDLQRDPCELIPNGVPMEEVRPNCYVVRRWWIGDAIRAACQT